MAVGAEKLKMNKLVNKIKCCFGFHNYKQIKEHCTVERCCNCSIFKTGPAEDSINEYFVFPDGSCITCPKIIKNVKNG